MQTILTDIPNYLTTLIEALRDKLRDKNFLARHRVRPQDFTRERQLTFPLLMLFVLQQTVKSIQRHVHEFLDELAHRELFEPVTTGAVTHARAKLKESAFSALGATSPQPSPPLRGGEGEERALIIAYRYCCSFEAPEVKT
jgi:hypothetical protein